MEKTGDDFSKAERKLLRRLAGEVYDAEATAILTELETSFKEWRSGKKEIPDLLQAIHEFHQVHSRKLWSRYQVLKSYEIVARGIVLGRIEEKRINPELLAKLRNTITTFKSLLGEAGQPVVPADGDTP